jgi:sensor histidine kinase YesM
MMNIYWSIIELLASTFENAVIMWVLGKFLRYRYTGVRKAALFIAFLALSTANVTFVNAHFQFEGAYAFSTMIIFVIYAGLALDGLFLIKVLIPIVSFTIILLINISVSYLITSFFGIDSTVFLTDNNGLRILALFLTKFIFLICAIFFVRLQKRSENKAFTLKKTELLTSIVIFITTMFIGFNAVELEMGYKNKEWLTLSLIASIIFINIFVLYMFRVMSKNNRREFEVTLLRTQLNEQKQLLEDAGGIATEIKQAEHDVKHHLLSTLSLLENDETEKAEVYIQKLLNEYETHIFKYINLDNSAINGILNFKIERCRKENIDIKCDVRADFSPFNEMDLCALIANLLDNAIEASENVKDPHITFTVKNQHNYLCITVKNSIEHSVLAENEKLKTTKSESKKHGIGIYSVRQIAEKYDGIANFYEESGSFIADIWLKVNVKKVAGDSVIAAPIETGVNVK